LSLRAARRPASDAEPRQVANCLSLTRITAAGLLSTVLVTTIPDPL
jgi:hypothetical protein